MGIAIDVSPDVAIGVGGWCHHIPTMVGMDHHSLGNQRPCLPQFGTICLAVADHTIDGIYHDAILDVSAGVYVSCSQIE